MIALNNVFFSRQDGTLKRTIINDLSLNIMAAEQIALLGDSGSGKTTLLNLLAGLLSPEAGEITVNEQKISAFNARELALYRRKIGIIFQHYQLLSPLNVKDNMCFQARLNGLSPSDDEIQKMATKLGLEGKLSAMPEQLSGGEQQRVGIGRALLNKPKLLLADEPTGNLDAARSQDIVALLKTLCQEQQIILIMVTHSQRLADQFGYQLFLKDGQING
ncbi:ATP-binding cassette domain-containing protein [Pseudoalteromonas sp.]|uniref:ABC transporter ATP-binding protein n=1 Tax=Pseudoalteromonas sp. TaxID=53249 RepID=UPI001BD12094|nr:ATP-binding cassette domain-containing protein [Pseudoalteromonas sp.]